MHRERSIHIDAEPGVVYDYISDVMKHPEWAAQKMEMRHTGGPERGVGTEFASLVHFGGKTPGKIVVEKEERPSLFAFQARDGSGTYHWEFRLTPENGGTHLTHAFDRVSAPFYIKAIQGWFMYPVFGKGMFDKGLANIKTNVEASVAV